MESDGGSLGCACQDDISKALTCNMGILRLENAEWFGTLDLRCPVTADQEKLAASVAEHLPGIEVTITTRKPPHHVPADGGLVSSLLGIPESDMIEISCSSPRGIRGRSPLTLIRRTGFAVSEERLFAGERRRAGEKPLPCGFSAREPVRATGKTVRGWS